ncbi:TBC domain-containing protein kinase-like protein isoform X2 [Condylostylus longicornis]|nr:TBC domain-containing protein kinase-like protein isoform X2 [Condylostylus longicornis]
MKPSDKSKMGAVTFFGKLHPGDVCGQNGLPLTPNSIAILGRAQQLMDIKHENLCQYLDVIRSKHERVVVVSEYYGINLKDKLSCIILEDYSVLRIMFQICRGLHFLHTSYGILCPHLEPKNILVDEHFNVKLFNYGLFYMTNNGEYVTFPFGNIRYTSPERLMGSGNNSKSDIWTIGVITMELLLGCKLWNNLNPASVMRRILSFCNNSKNIFEKIAREHNCFDKFLNINVAIRDLLNRCLSISVKDRPTAEEILNSNIFCNIDLLQNKIDINPNLQHLSGSLDKIYYLWQLAGGDVQVELKKEGLIRSEAPILSVPRVICLDGTNTGPNRSQNHLFDNRIVMLKMNNLIERLKNVAATTYYPSIYSQKLLSQSKTAMAEYPLVIKERDTEYQLFRVMLFSTLLKGYPFTRETIIKEAEIDIPPLLRGKIWAALLDVISDGSYEKIDKVTPTSTDRQIELDIPRCHQYDELLSSPEGHRKLKRLLKAWVTSHPQYVYWQGLDSLTAPFLYLNFNNEELAFLSLYKFIPKYLHWFFLKDNSAIINEYLGKFSQLIVFHEPVLAKHLISFNFIPQLFAIPWFLTMFSHVFPLHKIIHLWDKLILGDNSYPLFIGISVLKQLRTTLLNSGFNECILLFSDLPDIVMETCVIETQKMYIFTPKSISWRKHVINQNDPTEFDISNISLSELQNEICPRISAKDFIDLIINTPDKVIGVDLRGRQDYMRLNVPGSINIPFNSVLLGDHRLQSLNVENLEQMMNDKIVVIISKVHENGVLFSKFLVDCGVRYVCILHKGFDILQSSAFNILIQN